MSGAAAYPISGIPVSGYPPPVSGPPGQGGYTPVSAPPGEGTYGPPGHSASPPISAPPGHTGYPPVSGPPGHGDYPSLAGQPHAAPVSAAPVSGGSVPPWGMVAPPWSSVAPSQPVDRPADPEQDTDEPDPDEPTNGDAAGQAEGDAPERNRPMPIYEDLLDFPESTRPEPPAQPEPGAWPVNPPMFHQPAPVQPPGAYPMEPERPGRNRTVLALVAGGAVLAVVAAVGVGVVLLNREAAPPPAPVPASGAASPKVAGPPPGDLQLRDDTTTVTVTWTDPTNGGVPFVVAGGRAGQKLGVMATVDAGQTRYTVNGLSAKLDYCFTVLAVYATDSYSTSGQVCTDREGGATPN
ncbi:fibronectin type III domain-containing protein [Micromonospora chalcea]|uniref:fibronectin type III domain-containing protein n=1 Tax=Micromonospora chalcea TaxID=1874 RepID=UPI0033D3F565